MVRALGAAEPGTVAGLDAEAVALPDPVFEAIIEPIEKTVELTSVEGEINREAPSLTEALDVAGELRAPVLGLYGGADAGIPLVDVEKMRAACAAAGKTCEIVVYPDAPHAFFADYRPSYRAEAARDGWARLLEWLQRHGAA